LHVSDYLKQYELALLEYYHKHCKVVECANPEERILSKIGLLARKYYSDIVNSCSDEELYVLYDLADDLIMNPKNANAIYSLLEKGIMVRKCDRIAFMNVSFRRFVLATLTKSVKLQLEAKLGKQTGTWQGYRVTLILVILGLFVFIGIANQEFLDNLNQLFVAVGGGIALITTVIGLLSRKPKPAADQ